jgi:hypothetical protein
MEASHGSRRKTFEQPRIVVDGRRALVRVRGAKSLTGVFSDRIGYPPGEGRRRNGVSV